MNNKILNLLIVWLLAIVIVPGLFASDSTETNSVELNNNINQNYIILQKNDQKPFENTLIRFTLLKSSNINLCIFDLQGNKINTLVSEELEPGTHDILWNGNDKDGNPVKSGVYRYCIKSKDREQSEIIALLR